MEENNILTAIGIAAEVTGTELSKAAVLFIEQELANYSKEIVLTALHKTAKECRKGGFCLSEILKRIDAGRPGADEAWSLIPQDEETTVVWNNEICEAWGTCRYLIESGDMVAARMAFKSAYDRIVDRQKTHGKKPTWIPSLGFDNNGRIEPIRNAVELGRLPASSAKNLLPPGPEVDQILQIEQKKIKQITQN